MKNKRPRIVLAGGSGLLGRALANHFGNAGWEVNPNPLLIR
jgi:nucleoside-diphosphate-sugar epimerase